MGDAITVCVEYDDLLAVCLKHNRRHFNRYMVITHPSDARTIAVATACGCLVYLTDVFYAGGAAFNKGAAMEEGLEIYRGLHSGPAGRGGWLTILDADIVLPAEWSIDGLSADALYVPRRYMMDEYDCLAVDAFVVNGMMPDPYVLNQEHDYAGYCQTFHTQGKHVKDVRPWYGVRWKHCGGCDSEFEKLFPRYDKVRSPQAGPPAAVLHIGRCATNWHGRVSERLDGLPLPEGASDRESLHSEIMRVRDYNREKL